MIKQNNMKTKTIILFSFLLNIFLFSSCIFIGPSVKGNGEVVEERRNVENFDEIKTSRGMNVYLSQGNNKKVLVVADSNLMDAIETKVEDNTLVVTTSQNIRRSKSLKVFVTAPQINNIRSTAGSNVNSENQLKTDNLELNASAGSNIRLDVDAENLDVSATAGSNINLEGRSAIFTAKASAGSNIRAEDLTVKDCNARTNSGANIWIRVNSKFEGKASSGGNVFYSGNPESINSESSSGGNVIKN